MRSDLFSPQNAEAQTQQPGMKLQNGKMLKVALNGEMMVRQGAMVAYQGNIAVPGARRQRRRPVRQAAPDRRGRPADEVHRRR